MAVGGVLLLTISVCLIVCLAYIGIHESRRRDDIIKNGERTNAVVMKTRKEMITRRGSRYFVTLRYEVNAQTYEIEHYVGRRNLRYKDGETIEIIYHYRRR